MKKRVVVVGLGNYEVTMHIPTLQASSRAGLVGVVSLDQKDVDQCSKQFHVPGFTNLARCLDALKPDFVILAVYHKMKMMGKNNLLHTSYWIKLHFLLYFSYVVSDWRSSTSWKKYTS